MRERVRKLRREFVFLLALRVLPRRVAWFQWRARRLAARVGDEFSLASATRPRKLALLLQVARGRRRVVELGTGTAWTAISLLLSDRQRLMATYDPVDRPERGLYLKLVEPRVRGRLAFVQASGDGGPQDDRSVDLLFIDSSHDREDTIRELEAWRPVLGDGALVVFDDIDHPKYPGVREAVRELGLEGEERQGLFVHHVTV